MSSTKYRVVQWTTGNVGKSSARALAAHPEFELVGCFAWAGSKIGSDVGELLGGEDRKSTRLNSSHIQKSRMPSSA